MLTIPFQGPSLACCQTIQKDPLQIASLDLLIGELLLQLALPVSYQGRYEQSNEDSIPCQLGAETKRNRGHK